MIAEPPPVEDVTEGLVKVTVNLTAKAYAALVAASDREGDTRTDTINRALHLYELYTRPRRKFWRWGSKR